MATFEIWGPGMESQSVIKVEPLHTVEADRFVFNGPFIVFLDKSSENLHVAVQTPGLVIKKTN